MIQYLVGDEHALFIHTVVLHHGSFIYLLGDKYGIGTRVKPLIDKPDEPAREHLSAVKAHMGPCIAPGAALFNQIQAGPHCKVPARSGCGVRHGNSVPRHSYLQNFKYCLVS